MQNLNTLHNNSVSWDLKMEFNSAFKGLIQQAHRHLYIYRDPVTAVENDFLSLYFTYHFSSEAMSL